MAHLGDPKPGHIGFSGRTFELYPDGFYPFLLSKAGHIKTEGGEGGLSEDPYRQVLRGLCLSESAAFNEEVDGVLRNIPRITGVDVPAFTLHRTQQLGVRSYVDARKFFRGEDKIYGNGDCPLKLSQPEKANKPDKIGCFRRLTGNKIKAKKLKRGLRKAGMIPKVSNIPLWTGLMYERKGNGGGVLGRLQARIVIEQLKRLREGPR